MLSSEIVAQTWNSLLEEQGSSWGFKTLRDAENAFSGLQTAAEQGELTSTAILDVWENLRESLGHDILTFLAIDAVFDQLYFLAYDEEVKALLGDENFSLLETLRSMQFSHRELLQLADDGYISHESKDEPASAPMSGRVMRHYFELFFEGKQLWQQITEMDTNEDIMKAAANRVRRESEEAGVPEIEMTETERRKSGWDLTAEMVQVRMGSLNKEKVEQAANLIRQIIGE